jgi:hypothetical protein
MEKHIWNKVRVREENMKIRISKIKMKQQINK